MLESISKTVQRESGRGKSRGLLHSNGNLLLLSQLASMTHLVRVESVCTIPRIRQSVYELIEVGERGGRGAAKSSSKNSGGENSLMIKSRSWVISAWNPKVSAMVVEE